MPWFNVDDGFAVHHKTVKAGNAAVGLWVRAGSWCAQQLTDGFVPTHMVSVLGTPAQARKLVEAGLWMPTEGGFQFHEWSGQGRNPTRNEVLEKRRRDADKKAKARESKGQISENPQLETACPPGTQQGLPLGIPEGVRSTTPLPSNKDNDSLRSSSPDVPKSINAQTVTGAWVDAFREGTGQSPNRNMSGQVGREVKKLLDNGADPEVLLQAAEEIGLKGRSTVEREYLPLVARSRMKVVKSDDELDPDAILGPDYWSPPPMPADVEGDPAKRKAWIEKTKAERLQERLKEARRVIARRAA